MPATLRQRSRRRREARLWPLCHSPKRLRVLPGLSGERIRCWPHLLTEKGLFGLQFNDLSTKPALARKVADSKVISACLFFKMALLSAFPGAVNECQEQATLDWEKPLIVANPLKTAGNPSDNAIKGFLEVWHRQRGPEQHEGELASHLGQTAPALAARLHSSTHYFGIWRKLESVLFCSSQEPARMPWQKG